MSSASYLPSSAWFRVEKPTAHFAPSIDHMDGYVHVRLVLHRNCA